MNYKIKDYFSLFLSKTLQVVAPLSVIIRDIQNDTMNRQGRRLQSKNQSLRNISSYALFYRIISLILCLQYFCLLNVPSLVAQPMRTAPVPQQSNIVLDRSSMGRASVTNSAGGTAIVNVSKASSAGVSRTTFQDFNVGQKGAIINNSTVGGRSAIAGKVGANTYLQGKSAKIILNEVTGTNASQLNGRTEIFGQKAEYILANPFGINCDGCSYSNASRVTLSTGRAKMDSMGGLKSLEVDGGSISITGAGMGTIGVDNVDFVSEQVIVDAKLQGDSEVGMVLGKNDVYYSTRDALKTKQSSSEVDMGYALDVTEKGSMDVNAINVTNTKQDAIVRVAGNMNANSGNLVMTSDGRMVIRGNVQARGNVTVTSAKKDIEILNGVAKNTDGTFLLDAQGNTSIGSGKIVAGGVLTLEAGLGILNNGSNLIASSVYLSSGLDKEDQLSSNKDIINANGGNVIASNVIVATSTNGGSIQNLSGGGFSSNNWLELNSSSDVLNQGLLSGGFGYVTIKSSGNIENKESSLIEGWSGVSIVSEKTVNVRGDVFGGLGLVVTGHNINVGNSGEVLNTTLKSSRDMSITSNDDLHLNSGLLGAGRNLFLTSGGDMLIEHGMGVKAGVSINAVSDSTITNKGLLLANNRVALTSRNLFQNQGSILVQNVKVLDILLEKYSSNSSIMPTTSTDLNVMALMPSDLVSYTQAEINDMFSVKQTSNYVNAMGLSNGVIEISSTSGDVELGRDSKMGAAIINLNTANGTLRNEGTIKADILLSVTANNFTNEGTLNSISYLDVNVANLLINRASIIGNRGSVVLKASALNNSGSITSDYLQLASNRSIHNQSTGTINGDLYLDIVSGKLNTDGSVKNIGSVLNDGSITSNKGRAEIKVLGGSRSNLSNFGSIYGASVLSLSSEGDFTNGSTSFSARVKSEGNLIVQSLSDIVQNNVNSSMTGLAVQLNAQRNIVNAGSIISTGSGGENGLILFSGGSITSTGRLISDETASVNLIARSGDVRIGKGVMNINEADVVGGSIEIRASGNVSIDNSFLSAVGSPNQLKKAGGNFPFLIYSGTGGISGVGSKVLASEIVLSSSGNVNLEASEIGDSNTRLVNILSQDSGSLSLARSRVSSLGIFLSTKSGKIDVTNSELLARGSGDNDALSINSTSGFINAQNAVLGVAGLKAIGIYAGGVDTLNGINKSVDLSQTRVRGDQFSVTGLGDVVLNKANINVGFDGAFIASGAYQLNSTGKEYQLNSSGDRIISHNGGISADGVSFISLGGLSLNSIGNISAVQSGNKSVVFRAGSGSMLSMSSKGSITLGDAVVKGGAVNLSAENDLNYNASLIEAVANRKELASIYGGVSLLNHGYDSNGNDIVDAGLVLISNKGNINSGSRNSSLLGDGIDLYTFASGDGVGRINVGGTSIGRNFVRSVNLVSSNGIDITSGTLHGRNISIQSAKSSIRGVDSIIGSEYTDKLFISAKGEDNNISSEISFSGSSIKSKILSLIAVNSDVKLLSSDIVLGDGGMELFSSRGSSMISPNNVAVQLNNAIINSSGDVSFNVTNGGLSAQNANVNLLSSNVLSINSSGQGGVDITGANFTAGMIDVYSNNDLLFSRSNLQALANKVQLNHIYDRLYGTVHGKRGIVDIVGPALKLTSSNGNLYGSQANLGGDGISVSALLGQVVLDTSTINTNNSSSRYVNIFSNGALDVHHSIIKSSQINLESAGLGINAMKAEIGDANTALLSLRSMNDLQLGSSILKGSQVNLQSISGNVSFLKSNNIDRNASVESGRGGLNITAGDYVFDTNGNATGYNLMGSINADGVLFESLGNISLNAFGISNRDGRIETTLASSVSLNSSNEINLVNSSIKGGLVSIVAVNDIKGIGSGNIIALANRDMIARIGGITLDANNNYGYSIDSTGNILGDLIGAGLSITSTYGNIADSSSTLLPRGNLLGDGVSLSANLGKIDIKALAIGANSQSIASDDDDFSSSRFLSVTALQDINIVANQSADIIDYNSKRGAITFLGGMDGGRSVDLTAFKNITFDSITGEDISLSSLAGKIIGKNAKLGEVGVSKSIVLNARLGIDISNTRLNTGIKGGVVLQSASGDIVLDSIYGSLDSITNNRKSSFIGENGIVVVGATQRSSTGSLTYGYADSISAIGAMISSNGSTVFKAKDINLENSVLDDSLGSAHSNRRLTNLSINAENNLNIKGSSMEFDTVNIRAGSDIQRENSNIIASATLPQLVMSFGYVSEQDFYNKNITNYSSMSNEEKNEAIGNIYLNPNLRTVSIVSDNGDIQGSGGSVLGFSVGIEAINASIHMNNLTLGSIDGESGSLSVIAGKTINLENNTLGAKFQNIIASNIDGNATSGVDISGSNIIGGGIDDYGHISIKAGGVWNNSQHLLNKDTIQKSFQKLLDIGGDYYLLTQKDSPVDTTVDDSLIAEYLNADTGTGATPTTPTTPTTTRANGLLQNLTSAFTGQLVTNFATFLKSIDAGIASIGGTNNRLALKVNGRTLFQVGGTTTSFTEDKNTLIAALAQDRDGTIQRALKSYLDTLSSNGSNQELKTYINDNVQKNTAMITSFGSLTKELSNISSDLMDVIDAGGQSMSSRLAMYENQLVNYASYIDTTDKNYELIQTQLGDFKKLKEDVAIKARGSYRSASINAQDVNITNVSDVSFLAMGPTSTINIQGLEASNTGSLSFDANQINGSFKSLDIDTLSVRQDLSLTTDALFTGAQVSNIRIKNLLAQSINGDVIYGNRTTNGNAVYAPSDSLYLKAKGSVFTGDIISSNSANSGKLVDVLIDASHVNWLKGDATKINFSNSLSYSVDDNLLASDLKKHFVLDASVENNNFNHLTLISKKGNFTNDGQKIFARDSLTISAQGDIKNLSDGKAKTYATMDTDGGILSITSTQGNVVSNMKNIDYGNAEIDFLAMGKRVAKSYQDFVIKFNQKWIDNYNDTSFENGIYIGMSFGLKLVIDWTTQNPSENRYVDNSACGAGEENCEDLYYHALKLDSGLLTYNTDSDLYKYAKGTVDGDKIAKILETLNNSASSKVELAKALRELNGLHKKRASHHLEIDNWIDPFSMGMVGAPIIGSSSKKVIIKSAGSSN